MNTTVQELFTFIENSPTAFHAVKEMRDRLLAAGYEQLLESKPWNLAAGGKYFVVRNSSSLIAFRLPANTPLGFQIMASHSDSPIFKIKENPEMPSEGHYVKLNVEKYGGMLMAPWFDRPLSIAGRLAVRNGSGIETRLVDAKQDMVMIPNLAIHMNREANDGMKYSVQSDLLPLYGDETSAGSFLKRMAELAGVAEEDILAYDLFVYPRCAPSNWGANGEYISSGRLDDLECAFSSLQAFLSAGEGTSIPVHCVFDNEEVGSVTKQGAASTFLKDTLLRICECLGITGSGYRTMLASSFMLSADNAHAVHPAKPGKACPTNKPFMNEGVVIKFSANQKYCTDGVAAAVFKEICSQAEVPYQVFFNNSDVLGGGTLGNISTTQVAINAVDIGLAQLAMHSPYETAGVKDVDYMIGAARYFFESSIVEDGYGSYTIRHA